MWALKSMLTKHDSAQPARGGRHQQKNIDKRKKVDMRTELALRAAGNTVGNAALTRKGHTCHLLRDCAEPG